MNSKGERDCMLGATSKMEVKLTKTSVCRIGPWLLNGISNCCTLGATLRVKHQGRGRDRLWGMAMLHISYRS